MPGRTARDFPGRSRGYIVGDSRRYRPCRGTHGRGLSICRGGTTGYRGRGDLGRPRHQTRVQPLASTFRDRRFRRQGEEDQAMDRK